jgi:hypothetical protein
MWARALLCVLLAPAALAQVADPARSATGAVVSGVVYDSIARKPLADAVVQLVVADSLARPGYTAISDSSGRFTLRDVSDGRYTLGFFHPMLDSLGVEPLLREVTVTGGRPVRADLAIPSPARLRATICGRGLAEGLQGVVVGTVRNASDGTPVVGAAVSAVWLELSFTADGISRSVPRIAATALKNGWFSVCGVPSTATIEIMASQGADSTDRIDVQVPADGFARRELYIGKARVIVIGDTTPAADTAGPSPIRRRAGDGIVRGRVLTGAEGRPLAGASVSILDGPETRANDRGEWTLTGAPTGTRLLEVRAVGYYPERRAVDVVPDMAPVRTTLSTMQAALDTVRITAARLLGKDLTGFYDRSRGGPGRYLTPEDVAKRNPMFTSDLFHTIPGLRVERTSTGDKVLSMRRNFGGRCSPAVFIDGHQIPGLSADDIDSWANPDEIAGIEIYSGAGVPPQFHGGMYQSCGSIVIWTKPSPRPYTQRSWRSRAVVLASLVAFALGVSAILDRR